MKNSSSRAIFRPLHHFLKYFIGQSRHLPDTSIPIYPRFDRIVNTGLRFYLDHERTDHVNGLFSNYFPRKFIYSTTKHPDIHPFEQFKSNRGIRRYIYKRQKNNPNFSPNISRPTSIHRTFSTCVKTERTGKTGITIDRETFVSGREIENKGPVSIGGLVDRSLLVARSTVKNRRGKKRESRGT